MATDSIEVQIKVFIFINFTNTENTIATDDHGLAIHFLHPLVFIIYALMAMLQHHIGGCIMDNEEANKLPAICSNDGYDLIHPRLNPFGLWWSTGHVLIVIDIWRVVVSASKFKKMWRCV